MEITAEQFLKELHKKAPCPHVVVAWGDEEYYKKAIEIAMKKKILAEHEGEELNSWPFQGAFNVTDLREAVNSSSFFGGLNWIVIENPKLLEKKKTEVKTDKEAPHKRSSKELQEFITLLTDVPVYSYVLCQCAKLDKRSAFYKNMSKTAVTIECASLKSYRLRPWLAEQADRYGARFDAQAQDLIEQYAALSGDVPLLFLQQEIGKIALYAGKRKIWTADDVNQMFSQLPEISNFALSNAVGKRNLPQVLEALTVQHKKMRSHGRDLFPLSVGLVYNEVKRLLQVRELMSQGARQDTIASRLKLNPYVAKLAIEDTRRYQPEALEKCLVDLAHMQMDSRKNGRDWERLEEILICLVGKS
jgi:DNA polymerase-3 subunit delta